MYRLRVLKTRVAIVATLILLVQIVVFYGLPKTEEGKLRRPLSELPARVGDWAAIEEGVVEQEVRDVLRADDLVSRMYSSSNHPAPVNLFIAFFKSQAAGVAPHSPKNCLPGSGWVPSESDTLFVSVSGRSEPIEVNRYVVSKGDSKSLVLYWYQSHRRIVASEYKAKIYLVLDSLRYRRSDTSIVRVVVPITKDAQAAQSTAVQFIQSMFEPIESTLPA